MVFGFDREIGRRRRFLSIFSRESKFRTRKEKRLLPGGIGKKWRADSLVRSRRAPGKESVLRRCKDGRKRLRNGSVTVRPRGPSEICPNRFAWAMWLEVRWRDFRDCSGKRTAP